MCVAIAEIKWLWPLEWKETKQINFNEFQSFKNLIVDFISSCNVLCCFLQKFELWLVSMMLFFSFFSSPTSHKTQNRKVMHSFAKNKPAIQNLYTKLVLSNCEIWSHIPYNQPQKLNTQTLRVRVRDNDKQREKEKIKFLVFVCLIAKRKQYNVKLEVNSTEIACLFF